MTDEKKQSMQALIGAVSVFEIAIREHIEGTPGHTLRATSAAEDLGGAAYDYIEALGLADRMEKDGYSGSVADLALLIANRCDYGICDEEVEEMEGWINEIKEGVVND